MIADKLELLTKLQDIDSKVDNIKKVRGALPDEVKDLKTKLLDTIHVFKSIRMKMKLSKKISTIRKRQLKLLRL